MTDYREHKVSITLSHMAHRIIESDMRIFNQGKFGHFINTVIMEYKDESIASIKIAARNERERITRILHPYGGNLSASEKELVETLVRSYVQSLRERIKSYKGESQPTKKVRINNDNAIALNLEGESDYYDKEDYLNAGSYVKSLLEDYARQPFTKREEIIFKSTITTINDCINDHRIIRVSYTGLDGQTKTFKHKPYKIVVDNLNGYHYYLGLSYGNQDEGKLYPMRISRICDSRPLSIRSHITSAEEHMIKKFTEGKGIAYISGDIEAIEVELTPKGVLLYNSILHLRPSVAEKPMPGHDGNLIYKFKCTPEQIRNYFFQFGKESHILKPEYLREEFFTKYNEAAEEYRSK